MAGGLSEAQRDTIRRQVRDWPPMTDETVALVARLLTPSRTKRGGDRGNDVH